MENKTALITGASGNMGMAVVKKFIGEGYKVIGTVLPNDSSVMNFPAEQFEKVVVDLSSETAAHDFIENVILKYKKVDAVVLTVGGYAAGGIADTKTSDISKQYQLNFETAYNVARPVFNAMMKNGSGRIFLIGSKPGLTAKDGKGMIAYSLAKSLIFRLAELMNDEAKGKNIVTAVIVPSTIDTPQNRHSMPEVDFNKWVKPEQIADVIFFYSGDAALALREPVIKVYNNA
jgi:NAD(P)-dependent dehydrogenase (short-subunit alcohol dehydrogenase family)